MLIDTHCHIDQFPKPEDVVRECEGRKIRVIAVTNVPSHFAVAADRLKGHKLVSAALGMHPLFASKGIRELAAFKRMAPHADFIGEIGLDFSPNGVKSKAIQQRVFEEVLASIQGRQRFVTLHSRGAEAAVLEGLRRHKVNAAVFHWYSGPAKVLDDLLEEGHFVSINPAMLSSASGRRVIGRSPKERVLVESDGPFAKIGGQVCAPSTVDVVYENLATHWEMSRDAVVGCIQANFEAILSKFPSAARL